jgi:hypothetical protein
MTQNVARSIAEIIPLDPDSRAWMRRSRHAPANVEDPFWPEVSSLYALKNPAPMKPENRAGRVLTEIAVFFAAIAALIFVIWAFLPGGISP